MIDEGECKGATFDDLEVTEYFENYTGKSLEYILHVCGAAESVLDNEKMYDQFDSCQNL